jgi:para-nitrobenzyl esterase
MNFRLGLCCSIAAAVAFAAGAPDQAKIDTGMLKGSLHDGIAAFKGIPFAAPPTGANRWMPPQPVQPWHGVRPALDYGPDCMQLPFPGDAAPLGVTPSEDCLYANVWTPEKRSRKLPVIVWIYGGGFVNGGSSPSVYDGTHFAEHGLVFVSFNYRLGRFGFFAHPALTKEDPSGMLGNYAFMDQIAALQWVQRNIASFGGDPKRVTLFGESAGGMSVLALLTSPITRGLFQKAVVESGGGRSLMGAERKLSQSTPQAPSAEAAGLAFAKKHGIDGEGPAALEALRKLPAREVVDGLNMASMNTPTYSGPMIDGKICVESVEDALHKGHEWKMPLIIGANSADFGFTMARDMDALFAPFGKHAAEARTLYNPENSTNVFAIGMLIGADRLFREPARFVARTMSAAGEPAYEYRFSYVADSMRSQWHGAPHASEIPYVFDTVKARYGDKLTPEDEKIARQTNEYWVAFAKNGNPNAAGLPKWPEFKAATDELMNFTEKGPVGEPDPLKARLDLIEAQAK